MRTSFLQEQRGNASAQKCGGGKVFISLDEVNEEFGDLLEPVDHLSPDQLFERRWAQTVLQVSLERLREGIRISFGGCAAAGGTSALLPPLTVSSIRSAY